VWGAKLHTDFFTFLDFAVFASLALPFSMLLLVDYF